MNCRTCGFSLPQGVAHCTNCGAATAYNDAGANLPPTQLAGSQPAQQGTPPTSYGAPPPPPAYGATPNAYGYQSPAPTAYAGGMPQAPYAGGMPQASYGSGVPQVPPLMGQQFPQPVQKRNKTGKIVGIVAGSLVLVVVVIVLLASMLHNTPGSTSTSSSTVKAPSGLSIDSGAAAIITDVQTARSADKQTAEPSDLTTTFKTHQDIYVAFHLSLTGVDVTKQSYYVQAKFYANNKQAFDPQQLTLDQVAPGGYFLVQYYIATPAEVELYWCTKSDCSDGKLAQTTTFTITA